MAQGTAGSQYVHDEGGRLVRVIDASGTILEFVYDDTGNLVTIVRLSTSGLALFGFTPDHGPTATMVTIQGQGFSVTATANDVRFHGTPAPVVAASSSMLVVIVPAGATSGPITVTVAGETATNGQPFTVVGSPTISGVTPRLVVSEAAIASIVTVQVMGGNLEGSTFAFLPVFSPPSLTATSAMIDPGGGSATLDVSILAGVSGSFTAVATNAEGSSSAFSSPANSITILEGAEDPDADGLTNAQEIALGTDPFGEDTDADGFGDGVEVASASNPLDPQSTPIRLAYGVISIFNHTDPAAASGVAFGMSVSIFNRTVPDGYASGPDVSVENRPPP